MEDTSKAKNISIKDWKNDDKPREKLVSKGAAALSDAELIAILLGSGHQAFSAVDLARAILRKAEDNLHLLGKLQIKQLEEFKGMGPAKAVTLIAALELGKRRQYNDVLARKIVQSSSEAAVLLVPLLKDLEQEKMFVLYLNHANSIVSQEFISSGGLTSTIVDIRLIMRNALQHLATKIIIAHNHPSGNLKPSVSDKNTTQKVKAACQLFDIQLIDHLIISDQGYFSFADQGLL